MLRRASLTAVCLLAVLGATSCSSGGSSEQLPTTTNTGSAAPSTSQNGAPKVEHPKNLKGVTNACQLLTTDQLSQLGGGGEAQPGTNEGGEPECTWRNDNFRVNVSMFTRYGGMGQVYANKANFDNFAPSQVSGYPAARVNAQASLCRVVVGIANDQTVNVSYTKLGGKAPEMQDSCGYAEKIAAEVVKNIPDA